LKREQVLLDLEQKWKPNSHETVIAEFGWWQACPDFGKPSYPVKGEYSSNYNSLISGDSYDPVSGALPLRSFRCRIRRLNDFELIRRPGRS
jgi:hypothetical protein